MVRQLSGFIPWPTPTATQTRPPILAGCRCSVHPTTPSTPVGTTFNSTVVHGLQNLFQTRHLHLTLISTTAPGAVRHYDSGRALLQDVVNARVWNGFHFRSADIASRNLASQLAAWTLDHYFQPR